MLLNGSWSSLKVRARLNHSAKGAEITKLLPCLFYIFFDGFKWNKDGGVKLGKKQGQ
jgi:hypothetical protein